MLQPLKVRGPLPHKDHNHPARFRRWCDRIRSMTHNTFSLLFGVMSFWDLVGDGSVLLDNLAGLQTRIMLADRDVASHSHRVWRVALHHMVGSCALGA